MTRKDSSLDKDGLKSMAFFLVHKLKRAEESCCTLSDFLSPLLRIRNCGTCCFSVLAHSQTPFYILSGLTMHPNTHLILQMAVRIIRRICLKNTFKCLKRGLGESGDLICGSTSSTWTTRKKERHFAVLHKKNQVCQHKVWSSYQQTDVV